MDEKLAQWLELLAAKFETTVAHLWQVMVHQAAVQGCAYVLAIALTAVACTIWTKLVSKKTSVPSDLDAHPDWEYEGAVFAWISVWLIWLIWGIVFACMIPEILTCLLNPEFWALQKIISH